VDFPDALQAVLERRARITREDWSPPGMWAAAHVPPGFPVPPEYVSEPLLYLRTATGLSAYTPGHGDVFSDRWAALRQDPGAAGPPPGTGLPEALRAVLAGARAACASWDAPGRYIAAQYPDAHSKMTRPYLYQGDADGSMAPWTITAHDVFSRAWQVLPAPRAGGGGQNPAPGAALG